MSNDPKDTMVDLSKLMVGQGGQTSVNISVQTTPVSATPSMITSCNEGANLIGHENFTHNGGQSSD